ncbi:MAG: cyclic-phosphate processing receiver domain-containing protein, partial [Planctomycetota bacterium]
IELDKYLKDTVIISLDHDLTPSPLQSQDPGDGLDVAKFLATKQAACPVIIHSSNTERSKMMAGELELAGWIYKFVSPFGDDWIEIYWHEAVEQLLNNK